MIETDKDKELRQELKKITWGKYLAYGIIEIKIRDGECRVVEISRTYTDEDSKVIS